MDIGISGVLNSILRKGHEGVGGIEADSVGRVGVGGFVGVGRSYENMFLRCSGHDPRRGFRWKRKGVKASTQRKGVEI